MRKIILFLLCIALLASLAACNSVEELDPQRDNIAPSTTAPTDKTTVATTPSTLSTSNLSFEDYIEWLNELAKRRNVDGVTNLIESNLKEKPNEVTYSCDYAGGLVHLNIYAKDGRIANIFSTVSPYKLVDRGECANLSDAQVSAHALAILSIWGINESWNYEWHVQRLTEAPEQGNNSSLERTYTKDNWTFTVVMGNALVSVSAINSQCNQYAPDFTPEPTPEPTPKPTPAPTPSTNSSYTVTLSGSDEVFKQPSRYSAFVQTIGLSGIYTIVEEAYDDMGNLWGKLKSGIGWVLLSEATISSPRTCPQCGESEPEAIFTIDWKPGDICFGCHRYNDMGGEEGRIYCSECGADCTYRGLEEDGRCEDCHANN